MPKKLARKQFTSPGKHLDPKSHHLLFKTLTNKHIHAKSQQNPSLKTQKLLAGRNSFYWFTQVSLLNFRKITKGRPPLKKTIGRLLVLL
jgi:hypothetical protein